MSRLSVILVVFSLTTFLIFTIFLRTSSSRMFYEYRTLCVERDNLSQQLWQKQLRFECLVNPAGIPSVTLPRNPERQENE